MDPQDGKVSRLCKSACEESHDQQRFKRFVCVVSPQRIVKKKSSVQFAIYFKAVQGDGELQYAASQTSADFQLSDLQANETNDKNQNIPHDLHITRQPYSLLELAVKDTSVMLSTLQNFYCLIDQ